MDRGNSRFKTPQWLVEVTVDKFMMRWKCVNRMIFESGLVEMKILEEFSYPSLEIEAVWVIFVGVKKEGEMFPW